MKVVNKKSRNILSEGRTFGIGFAWAEKKGNNIETINPVSPCKDYLNDQCAVEEGYKEFSIYGIKSIKRKLFNDDYGYIVIRAGDSSHNEEKNQELSAREQNIKDLLEKNYTNIKDVLNSIEVNLIKEKTEIYKANDDYYVIKVPKLWTINGPMISFYSLVVRNSIFGAKTIEDIFLGKRFYDQDSSFLPHALCFYYLLKNKHIPEINYSDKKFSMSGSSVHNYGCVEYIKEYFGKQLIN